MQSQIRLSEAMQQQLRCPICRAVLEQHGDRFRCTDVACGGSFPIVNGIPVLINESASVFSIDDIVSQGDYVFHTQTAGLRNTLKRLMPRLSKNIKGEQNYDTFARLLLERSPAPTVLVVGGHVAGEGMESLLRHAHIELVESDVTFGSRTNLVCDAHDSPFDDASFDGVVAQAVLEHVVDPYRCVAEIHRVLKLGGLVYAETPFMQQVHGERYDFTRFTHLGHRRLFREFEEIESGAVCGPGMALALSYQAFLLSFAASRNARNLIRLFARLTAFPLKYFDPYLIDKAGTLDTAAGIYFLGRKGDQALSDQELIEGYRGAL